ncbi:MAG: hypothetical protein JWM73_2230 [Solirubrobacterales bacterium]|jgi:hypothetical protein|nr:hypothetical protein [Solirubrobacterales bacterium]
MAVKRDRPEHGAPGELRTADGRSVRVKLPPGLEPPVDIREATAKKPRPEEPQDPRSSLLRNVPPYGAA